ncbi:N-6 DNA methylase [Methylobacterium currus]|uniref:HsdM family class I SAM-dependent methyltransferase n=1 Tax=Methylobacterium currus TaxID=2051553 RepID=UPI001E283139|nr:N-6 DNA methylase [Methylobacterium currus]UHC14460.1 N-6 DNA methylase [Methylobacterium currus]
MEPENGIIAELAGRQGLARAPLFRSGEVPDVGEHEVLLDGLFGSFAVSTVYDVDPFEASSWAWSSNLPHHVLISGNRVSALRWDRPHNPVIFDKSAVLERPIEFYEHLRNDKVDGSKSIIEHSIDLFRSIRNLVHKARIEDEASMSAYLAILGALSKGIEPYGANLRDVAQIFSLPRGATDIVAELPQPALSNIINSFSFPSMGNKNISTLPALALRHASGSIFQEAHHHLVGGPPIDMFDYVGPARAAKPPRSVVHFTPPSLARALCEQALIALGDLQQRKQLIVADFACGSGAFLIEALRALERMNYRGRIILIGRDISHTAVDMARFVIRIAAEEWPGKGRVHLDLEVSDSLRRNENITADVIVMNPPFAQWQNMSEVEREMFTTEVRGESIGRPDLSMVFVLRALNHLGKNGAMAVLLPASVIEARSGAHWRNRISERSSIYLTAIFDNQRLFSHALVRVGALVLTRRDSRERTDLRAGNGPEDAGDALRALRRGRDDVGGSPRSTFTIRRTRQDSAAAGWSRSASSGELSKRAISSGLPTVSSMFSIQQGIRTGENAAFVITDKHLFALPSSERLYFRLAITSRGISEGRITKYSNVFYPYNMSSRLISSEEELKDKMPNYYNHLLKFKSKLLNRRGRNKNWWELSERRRELERDQPVFVSKYWAGPGGFVAKTDVNSVVLQGFGWTAIGEYKEKIGSNFADQDISAAYLAILNSRTFFSLVAEHAPPTGGGQLDMSRRYLERVPIVDLVHSYEKKLPVIAELALFARSRYMQYAQSSRLTTEDAEACIRDLFGLRDQDKSHLSTSNILENETVPYWLMPFIDRGLEGTDREYRVQVLIRLQELAIAGTYSEIDVALERAPLPQLAETSLMTLLRGTYRFRSRLSGWNNFRDRIAEEFERRGAPVEKLMIGL